MTKMTRPKAKEEGKAEAKMIPGRTMVKIGAAKIGAKIVAGVGIVLGAMVVGGKEIPTPSKNATNPRAGAPRPTRSRKAGVVGGRGRATLAQKMNPPGSLWL